MVKKLLFSPGTAPNLSTGCISYPKFMTIAEVFLALHSSCETNPATRQEDSLQDSLRSLAALLLPSEDPGTIMQTAMKAYLGSQPGL